MAIGYNIKVSKVGLGIITCDREDFYKNCCAAIPTTVVDHIVTVNDGAPYKHNFSGTYTYQNDVNLGVGKSKNKAMQHLLNCGCEHIFLIEDDIIVKDETVFQKYIDTAAASGLWHLMFGYHGPANKKKSDNTVCPKAVVDYGAHQVAFNHNCVGAFCYYHKGVLKNIGLMDEVFKNAWEHVEHSYRIVKAGLLPAYWWWPDVANSYEYLNEQACSEENSVIRWKDSKEKTPNKEWEENISRGAKYFHTKHGSSPISVPDEPIDIIEQRLKLIKQRYSKNGSKI